MFEEQEADTPEAKSMGRWMAVFFGLAVVCAIFFGLGYKAGKSSAPAVLNTSDAAVSQSNAPVTVSTNKPQAGVPQSSAPANTTAQPQDNLTFYKSVENKQADAKLTPAPAQSPPPVAVITKPPVAVEKTIPSPRANSQAVPLDAHSGTTSTYVVQVAAVSREEDAEALVSALRKKDYPVFVVNNLPGDKLFHVQVGPFNNIADAQAMRGKLAADGYNPILRK